MGVEPLEESQRVPGVLIEFAPTHREGLRQEPFLFLPGLCSSRLLKNSVFGSLHTVQGRTVIFDGCTPLEMGGI